MARIHLFALSLSVSALTLVGVADAKVGGASSAAVNFTAVGPGGLKIEGKGSELAVTDDATNITAVVPLANLKTGIDLRDKHLREKYLEVGKFPTAELVVPRASLKLPAGAGQAQGTMKLHGKTKVVTFNYKVDKNGAKLDVSGDVQININDYGIQVPSYLGVTVKPDVSISVRFSATEA